MTTSYDVDAYVVELRAKIRELEAELAALKESEPEAKARVLAKVRSLLARAEKAEALLEFEKSVSKTALARVAELEETDPIRRMHLQLARESREKEE